MGSLLTDTDLRSSGEVRQEKVCRISPDTIITPAAKDYLRENEIRLEYIGTDRRGMSVAAIPEQDGKPVYIDGKTGRKLYEKPEEMTHLRGNILVSKNDPRIEFRGRLDSLIAEILCVQVTAEDMRARGVVSDLDDALRAVRSVLGAEVKDEALPEMQIMGMDAAELRRQSHYVQEVFGIPHPIPDHSMGRLAMELNLIRTRVRETELSAVKAFSGEDGNCLRGDIVKELNRLSSCIYIIFCRLLSGYYQNS